MSTSRLAETWILTALAGIAGVSLLCRFLPVTNVATLALAASAPYVSVLTLIGVAAVSRGRVSIPALMALGMAVISLAVQISWYYVGSSAATGTGDVPVRVLAANIRNGEADASAFVDLARNSADVILVSELTPESVQRFSAAGIGQLFPFSHLIPAPLAGGIGIWSRFPLTPVAVPRHEFAAAPVARIRVPGVRIETTLVGIHVKSPFGDGQITVDDWRGGLDHVKGQLARLAANVGNGSVIAAGDFNSTPDIRQFRGLLVDGYRDAVEQLGAGFSPTFPAGTWHPPLITIDHVLTRNAVASAIAAVDLPGSDHRALVATIAVPAS